ncbi:MAG: hypothetical protein RIE24_05375 [Silicimonas sp.]|jgi:hypothetical protein|uniref:hypothetical protein n=1 Tax=Alphaproteobacteria TaxID=28211 RepID=UPI0032F064EF
MPLLEFVGGIIVLGIALVIIVGGAAVYGGALVIFGAILLSTGWIPILMCATDVHMSIGEGFVGTWALWSWWLYLAATIGVIVVMIVRPDPDGLPPALKFVAMFYTYDTVRAVKGVSVDAAGFVRAAKQRASSVYDARLEERAMRQEEVRIRAEAKRTKAAAVLAEAAIEREEQRARQRTYEGEETNDEQR